MNCECSNWCRADISSYHNLRGKDGLPIMTNHHPNCPNYNDSLIDVWRVDGGNAPVYFDSESDAESERENYEGVGFDLDPVVTKEKMHKEIYEHLPEFEGF